MPYCPKCDRLVETLSSANDMCPRCYTRENTSESVWKSAAKVDNLAEAGYLVSRLAGEDIDARIVELESFSAMSGAWSSTYVLQVDAESLSAAREILLSEAEEIRSEETDFDGFGEPMDDEPVHLVFWRPVALMAVAGLATLWLGQRAADPRPRIAPNRSAAALGSAVESARAPFVVLTDAGRIQHRLHYRSASRMWYLESDTDGNGTLDRIQRFVIEPAE